MKLIALLALSTGCAGTLSAKEAQTLHAQNNSALSRALSKRGLTELPAVELDDGATTLGDPTPVEFMHPSLGRTVVSAPLLDHIFAVDAQGGVHDVAITVKYTRRERENVQSCGPGAGGGARPADPPGIAPGPQPMRRRYARLAAAQTIGPALKLEVAYVRIEPVYMTGRMCNEIP